MNLFAKASAWLPAMEQKAAGVAVTYTRRVNGADQSLTLTAAVGRTAHESQQKDGAWLVHGDRDYLISVADLAFGVPALGDRVTEVIEGVPVTFAVQNAANGELPWRYSGPDLVTWRINVKRV